jgi:hypothetical protein
MADVCFWHKADIDLTRSMSAFDPKRTFDPVLPKPQDKPNPATIEVRLLR